MRCALVLTAAVALMLAAQIDRPAAQSDSQPAALDATKSPVRLSEQDKAVVIKAAVEDKSHQKTPKEFTPAVGASVPNTLYGHVFKPEVANKVPALKHYWYAYLDREVVLLDSMKKVVAVIPLPAKYAFGGQGNHGAAEPANESAAEPANESKDKDGASTTGSVPAYTSPETIR